MPKNLILLSDGTGNEPKLTGETNVLRLFGMLPRTNEQVVWYDPGVGTMGSPKALTAATRLLTKIGGLAFGYGMKDNVVLAYRFLIDNYEEGDRIFLFGFSRGAYTARAIAGLLYQIGLLRSGQENMIPYALKLFWWHHQGRIDESVWEEADRFSRQFCREDFQRRLDEKVHHVGVWDTVKAAGVFRGYLRLPWTAEMPMTKSMSHAVSIDEKRRPFRPNLLSTEAPGLARGDFKEVWFAGVHSDVGGTFEPDHRLADITFEWLVSEAIERGLTVDQTKYGSFRDQPASNASGEIHNMGWKWWLSTLFFHRTIPNNATLHESVRVRMESDGNGTRAYEPRLPRDVAWEAWPHSG